MTTQANPTSPQVLQTYTLLQIAAEAFLGIDRESPAATPGGSYPVDLSAGLLTVGNLHSSRMTEGQASKFAQEWKVLSHQPSTATGFSATVRTALLEASNLRAVDGSATVWGDQDKAEGDVLERALNALAELTLGGGVFTSFYAGAHLKSLRKA